MQALKILAASAVMATFATVSVAQVAPIPARVVPGAQIVDAAQALRAEIAAVVAQCSVVPDECFEQVRLLMEQAVAAGFDRTDVAAGVIASFVSAGQAQALELGTIATVVSALTAVPGLSNDFVGQLRTITAALQSDEFQSIDANAIVAFGEERGVVGGSSTDVVGVEEEEEEFETSDSETFVDSRT
jgi:hypothetical protein